MVDKYLVAHADVWHYLPNRPAFSQILEFLDSDPRIALAKSTKDILANKQAGKISMVIGWQDSFALEEENGNEWRFSRPPQTKLREYYELGLRTANLTYQLSNQFGGGMLDPEARLTTQGKYIVGKMQDLGILVDVCGHNGEQTNLDIIAMARRPVAITHGCCKALNDNPRNSSDRVIEAMAKTGGLMAVAALDAFLTWGAKDAPRVDSGPFPPRANVARYVDEFDHLKQLVGIDHIGFGTDFTSDIEAADPSKIFELPPEMMYNESPSISTSRVSRAFPISETSAPKWSTAVTQPKRSRRFLAATGCASLARRGILNAPPLLDRQLRSEQRSNLIACGLSSTGAGRSRAG